MKRFGRMKIKVGLTLSLLLCNVALMAQNAMRFTTKMVENRIYPSSRLTV